jgi:hypothetical protein
VRALVAIGAAFLVLLVPSGATAQVEGPTLAREPASLTVPPPGFRLTGRDALALARKQDKVRREVERAGHPLRAKVLLSGSEYWVVRFYDGAHRRADVLLNGRTGRIKYVSSGRELEWPGLARGGHGPYARAVHKLLVIAGLLFLLPFLDRRRPFRLLHLDLLMILSLGLSFGFAEAGNVYASTPLRYITFAYLLPRMLVLALRPRAREQGPLSWMPTAALARALGALLVIRYGLDIAYGQVTDIGYGSLYGADQILKGYELFDPSWHLGSYGPAMYLAYVPFAALFPFDLSQTDTAGALAAAIVWDLGTVAALYAVGRRLRAGRAGHRLGVILAFAFAACPWSSFVLSRNANDGLIAFLIALVLLVATSPAARGALLGVATAAKFAPLILGGLFLRVGRERTARTAVVYAAAVALVTAALIVRYLPDGGLRDFWDSTLGFEFSRSAPFSLWGLYPATKPLRWVVVAFGAALAAALIVLPRERTLPRLAAGGAALVLTAQLVSTYWFFFYFVWVLPFALVAIFAQLDERAAAEPHGTSGVPVAVADRMPRSFSRKK